jgi:hypothetical protein
MLKLIVNFQDQYIRLCVKFNFWGYGVRLMFKLVFTAIV